MQIEELDLDVRTYNQVKRTGINTVEELLDKLYLPDSVRDFPTRTMLHIEQALKAAGTVKYVRGDYITADDVKPVPLSWDALHGMCGKLIARDISTESQQAFRVCWVYQFSGDDSRIIYQYNGNNYANSADDGKFYALRTEEPEMIVTEQRTPPADANLAVTEQYTTAYNLNVKIHTSMQAIQQNLYDMCSALKQMRDGKLYRELGYQNFEEYCENGAGIGRRHAYRFITILETLPPDFVTSMSQIGMTKLTLLTALTDDQREELTQTVDLESTTVRELKAQIAALQSQNADTEKARADAEERAQKWYDEAESKGRQLTENHAKLVKSEERNGRLQEQIDELENRPIDVVAVPEPSHELQNMQDAMRRINLEHEQWSAKIQDDHIRHVQEINRQHRAETDALRAEYEEKLAAAQAAPAEAPDSKEVFKVYLAAVIDAAKRMMAFLSAHPDAACRAQAEKAFQTILQEVNNEQAV